MFPGLKFLSGFMASILIELHRSSIQLVEGFDKWGIDRKSDMVEVVIDRVDKIFGYMDQSIENPTEPDDKFGSSFHHMRG